jgi:dUTP pyrophosphatase
MSEFDENRTLYQNPTQFQLSCFNPIELLNTYDKYMHLKLYVNNNNDNNDNDELKQKYIDAACNHNNKILNFNNPYLDAGFDLFNPSRKEIFENNQSVCSSFSGNRMSVINKINFGITCSAQMITDLNKVYNTGYYMYPRSSLSKTKLRLANSTGIIDSGYRGELIGMFDLINLSHNEEYLVDKYDRLLQICAPGLVPIVVEVVNTFEELGSQTERGAGGFGSTGR